MKRTPVSLCLVLALTCAPLAVAGCSSTTKVTTETTSTDAPVVERQTTTEIHHEDSSSCSGVLSCTVDVIGEVIALPFRAVGALFRAIF